MYQNQSVSMEEACSQREIIKKWICFWILSNCIWVLGQTGWAYSVDPDQMPQNVESDQGLHIFAFTQQCLDTSTGSEMDLFRF